MRADAAKGSYLAIFLVKIEQVTELRATHVLLGVAIRRALNKQAREARE
jgi:hypothetical protein